MSYDGIDFLLGTLPRVWVKSHAKEEYGNRRVRLGNRTISTIGDIQKTFVTDRI
jgi:hypothetical protein